MFGNHGSTSRYLYLTLAGSEKAVQQPPLISIKRDKNIGNFLVICSFQTNDQPDFHSLMMENLSQTTR